jgi:hypothetical protein
MTIYARTEEGQLAAYSPGSVLPRKLRSLLKVIDGKTPVSIYNNSLKAFGDVEGVLSSLQMAGLIRAISQSQGYADEFAGAAAAPMSTNAGWGSTGSQASGRESQFFGNSVPLGAQIQAGFSASNAMTAEKSVVRSQALAHAVDLMSNFVLTYAPEQSFMVLKELEELTDLEQLAVTLGGYEMLIAHLGAVAQEHLLLVKQILRDNL